MRVNEIRSNLRILRRHYEQLLDLGQELEENENCFFEEKNLRYFHLFTARVARLIDMTGTVREYTFQLRELQESKLNIKQNHIITILTIVTTIFAPLTLITGWYGMNFAHMPELQSVWGYPAVILVSLLIAGGCLFYFHKKKWL